MLTTNTLPQVFPEFEVALLLPTWPGGGFAVAAPGGEPAFANSVVNLAGLAIVDVDVVFAAFALVAVEVEISAGGIPDADIIPMLYLVDYLLGWATVEIGEFDFGVV